MAASIHFGGTYRGRPSDKSPNSFGNVLRALFFGNSHIDP